MVLLAETPQSLSKEQVALLEQLKSLAKDKTFPEGTKQNKDAARFAARRDKR